MHEDVKHELLRKHVVSRMSSLHRKAYFTYIFRAYWPRAAILGGRGAELAWVETGYDVETILDQSHFCISFQGTAVHGTWYLLRV